MPSAIRAPSSSRTFVRLSPLDGTIASVAPAFDEADARAAADEAAAALASWSALGPNARRAILNWTADRLEAKSAAFESAMMKEIGSTQAWARFNVKLAADIVREAAALTTQIAGEVIPSDRAGSMAMAVREPVGVVLGIAPWNAPVILGVRSIAMPLACGNTCVFKGSELCPETHRLIFETFMEGGLPAGALMFVTNAPHDAAKVVGALIDHPAIRRINFTGSTMVGKIIARRAAEHLKPCLLELGGKAPFVVLEDADIGEAVSAAAFGAFMNQGQICMSTERIIVVDAIADEFVARFTAKAATLSAGDPRDATTPLGAVVDAATVERALALIDDALGAGAALVVGSAPEGVLMSAHVVDRVTPSMKLFREESFGPVTAIIRAKDEAEAIELANDTEYGLSAAVFTRDITRGLAVARQIKSGICHINGPTVHDEAQMPFGGVKGSGYGRFGGKAGIEAFTELRWITVNTQPGHFPI